MRDQHPSGGMLQNIERVAFQSRNCCVTGGTSLLRFVFCLSLLASSVLLIGLTAQAQDMSKQQDQLLSQESGFLGDYYSKLQPDPNNADLLIYWRNKDVLKNSNKFILNPVIVYLLPEAQQRGIDPEQLAKLTQYFTKAISSELKSGHYELVTKPGTGVMVLRVAITNVEPTGGTENAALKGAEVAATHAAAPGVALLVPRFNVGKVSIKGEVVDSVSGEVMVAVMSSKCGRRYFAYHRPTFRFTIGRIAHVHVSTKFQAIATMCSS